METFSALLAPCAGNSPVPGEFPSQRPVTRSLDIFFDLSLNKRLSKRSRRRWFETPSRSLWRHCNGKLTQTYLLCLAAGWYPDNTEEISTTVSLQLVENRKRADFVPFLLPVSDANPFSASNNAFFIYVFKSFNRRMVSLNHKGGFTRPEFYIDTGLIFMYQFMRRGSFHIVSDFITPMRFYGTWLNFVTRNLCGTHIGLSVMIRFIIFSLSRY